MAVTPRSKAPAKKQPANAVAPEELSPAPIVLVVGGEDLLAERAMAALVQRARAADPEVVIETVEAAGYESGRLEQLASPSLFGGGTVVLVNGVEATNDAFVTDATRYLGHAAPEVCVVLRHSGGQRARGLLDAARKTGAPEAACLPITKDEEKVDFAVGEFRRLGRRASPQAVRALVDAVGSDLRELASSCARLAEDAVACGDGRIEADIVEQWFGGRVEVTGFKVADAAVAGRADQALALLRHALATGADPVPLVAALAAKLRGMAKVSSAGGGRSADQAAALGMAPWQVDRARRELSGWSDQGMASAITVIAEADTAVKGGGRDPVYAVERAVLSIAQLRGT
ncbi:MAG TPA: DNA polymerase III subunit delta [Kineosporiaceae bacterium]|nr:DNA polymerase III subunit delta [Kineosporiaceae bacterium]